MTTTLVRDIVNNEAQIASTDYTLVIDPQGTQLAAAKACEAEVFLEAYGNTSEQWAEEYGPYDGASLFLAVIDNHSHEAVGMMRLIMPSDSPVKSLADLGREPWNIDGARSARAAGIDVARTWDVATLAVRRKKGRGGLISAALYHAMFEVVRANRAGWIVMIIDGRARRLLDMSGIRTAPLPATRPGAYLGSTDSAPVWADVTRMADVQRVVNPDAYRLIRQGIGLDSISLPSNYAVRSLRSEQTNRSTLRSV